MGDSRLIGTELSKSERAKEGQVDCPDFDRRLASKRVSADFSAGVKAWGKSQAFASFIGVSEGFLSHACAGNKLPPMWAVDAFRGNVDATLTYSAGPLHSVGHIAVPAKTEISLTTEQVQFLVEMRDALGEVAFNAVLARFAVRLFHCEPEMLALAFKAHLQMGSP